MILSFVLRHSIWYLETLFLESITFFFFDYTQKYTIPWEKSKENIKLCLHPNCEGLAIGVELEIMLKYTWFDQDISPILEDWADSLKGERSTSMVEWWEKVVWDKAIGMVK